MPVHFLDRDHRPANGPVAVGIVLETSLEDGFDTILAEAGNTRSRMVGIPSGGSPPFALRIITRRTGSDRYVRDQFARKPAKHASRPCSDASKRHPIDTPCTRIDVRQPIGVDRGCPPRQILS